MAYEHIDCVYDGVSKDSKGHNYTITHLLPQGLRKEGKKWEKYFKTFYLAHISPFNQFKLEALCKWNQRWSGLHLSLAETKVQKDP